LLRPASKVDQTSSLVLPAPQIRPIPVITTRRFKTAYLPNQSHADATSLRMFLDVIDRVANALNLLGVLVRDFDGEFFFESHNQLDRVERVGAEIIDEPRVCGHFALVDSEFIDDYLFYPFLNGTFSHFVSSSHQNVRQTSVCRFRDAVDLRQQTERTENRGRKSSKLIMTDDG